MPEIGGPGRAGALVLKDRKGGEGVISGNRVENQPQNSFLFGGSGDQQNQQRDFGRKKDIEKDVHHLGMAKRFRTAIGRVQ